MRSLLRQQGLGHKEGIRDQGIRGDRFRGNHGVKGGEGKTASRSLRVVYISYNDAEGPTEKW